MKNKSIIITFISLMLIAFVLLFLVIQEYGEKKIEKEKQQNNQEEGIKEVKTLTPNQLKKEEEKINKINELSQKHKNDKKVEISEDWEVIKLHSNITTDKIESTSVVWEEENVSFWKRDTRIINPWINWDISHMQKSTKKDNTAEIGLNNGWITVNKKDDFKTEEKSKIDKIKSEMENQKNNTNQLNNNSWSTTNTWTVDNMPPAHTSVTPVSEYKKFMNN